MTQIRHFPRLFEPGKIGTMVLKNRIVMPAMGNRFADEAGFVTERLKDYYEERAKGGVALVIVEFTPVDPLGRARPLQVRIDDDKFIPGLAELAQVIKKHGARAGIQLHHAGHSTKASVTGRPPLAPSSIQRPGFDQPDELTIEQIHEITGRFVAAAKRAQQAGFDCVEIHAAHLYLFAQFLSRFWNKRQDAYGGDLRNRARFLIETLEAIKKTVGKDYPVWARINGIECSSGGDFPLQDAQALGPMLQAAGSDAINVSVWGDYVGPQASIHRQPMSEPGGNLIPLAEAVKKGVDIPVITVGKIDLDLAERTLGEGKADFIAMGRALRADPYLPEKAMTGKVAEIRPCLTCNLCAARCTVNAAMGHEREYSIRPAQTKKRVSVIGGGPAGMEAARVAALRGHDVAIYEQNGRLGGQMLLAAIPPHKERIADFISYLTSQIQKLPIQVRLNVTVTPEEILKSRPEVLILATGVLPFVPDIPGASGKNVVLAEDVLTGKSPVGQKAVIIGGELVGCETAEFLAIRGKNVTIVRRGANLAVKVEQSTREKLLPRLVALGVVMLTGVEYRQITDAGLQLIIDGASRMIESDTIVLAAGSKPNKRLFEALQGKARQIQLAGDCVEPRNIMEAIADGCRIANNL